MWRSIDHTERLGPYSSHVRKLDGDGDSMDKNDGATEMNNVRGNHYEPPGTHHEPAGRAHENPIQMPEPAVRGQGSMPR